MTIAELQFLKMVPEMLRDIRDELRRLNDTLSANEQETNKTIEK